MWVDKCICDEIPWLTRYEWNCPKNYLPFIVSLNNSDDMVKLFFHRNMEWSEYIDSIKFWHNKVNPCESSICIHSGNVIFVSCIWNWSWSSDVHLQKLKWLRVLRFRWCECHFMTFPRMTSYTQIFIKRIIWTLKSRLN